MTAADRVAVVITCFNLGRTLEEALASVHEQTTPASEVVIVDDGSDEIYTVQVLDRLLASGERVERTANGGVSAARNHGARLTTAPLLIFLDADDALDPAYIEKTVARLEARPELDFVSTGQRGFGAADYEWAPPDPHLVGSMAAGVVHVSSLMRRTVWQAVGGWNETLSAYEELDFWTTVLEHGITGEVIAEPLLHYRVRPDSMWHSAIEPESHCRLMSGFYERHLDTVEAHAEELLMAKERFMLSQRQHQRHLVHLQAGLEAELDELHREIEDEVQALQRLGSDRVDWGELRRLSPLSPAWGLDRGRPLDRYYVEAFLDRHRSDIAGAVLEIKDPGYTRQYGGERVTSSAVLDVDPRNPLATITADLTAADQVAESSFDCFILTQTLNVIYGVRGALEHAFRVLKPGGVLLCTVSALNRISYEDRGLDGDFWRFTEASLRRLFSEMLPADAFEVTGFGNVLACTAFLHGVAIHELRRDELEHNDPYFPLVYGVRAVKPGGAPAVRVDPEAEARAAILMYHRVADEDLDPHGLCVTPERFRRQMQLLAREYRPVALPDLVAQLQRGHLESRQVAVTFDDGYLDNLDTASEILSELGIPATFFITDEGLDGEHEYWWDVLVRIFLGAYELPAKLEVGLPDTSLEVGLSGHDARRAAHDLLWDRLFAMGADERDEFMARLMRWSGLPQGPVAGRRPMNGDEIRSLAARPGLRIGAHTSHHLRLPIHGTEVVQREIFANRERLQALTGEPLDLFAYPYGEHDGRVVGVVRDLGFTAAVTTESALVHGGSDVLRLPRIAVVPDVHDNLGDLLRGL